MQLRQPSPDALVSFSDFLLDRFGLVASMQVALLASVAVHALVIVGVSISPPGVPRFDAPHNVMDVVLVNARSASKPQKADALAQAELVRFRGLDHQIDDSDARTQMLTKIGTFLDNLIGH